MGAEGRSRIAVILTGGTIDSLGTDRLDMAWYFEANRRLEHGALLARIPEINSFASVEEVPFRGLPSHALQAEDWLALGVRIQEQLERAGADGVVVTHGTNTLEETAYFLTLTLKTDRPVVLVGAMRPASGLSADGDFNLLNAIRVAADPGSRGKGVLVLLNDTIHTARDVTKTATFRLQTFQGRDLGPAGFADPDGSVVYYHSSERLHTLRSEFDIRRLTHLPRVDVVVSYVGADGALIDAAVAAGAQGLVSAGTGGGRPTPLEDEALDRARDAGVVVCQASRVGSGRVVRAPSLRARGIVTADNLLPWKARILLALALTQTRDPDAIQAMFERY
jgi:L-asparaginase